MEWIDYLVSAPEGYYPFIVSLCIMLSIATIEFTATILGVGIFSFLDSLVPDIEWEASPLDFLSLGKVPIYILMILFLTYFGASGLALQFAAEALVGFPMPTILASVIAFAIACAPMKMSAMFITKVMPDVHTSAVSTYTFIGKQAEVVLGISSEGHPAEAKLKDHHGRTHYVMVEPKLPGMTYKKGDIITIDQKKNDTVYLVF